MYFLFVRTIFKSVALDYVPTEVPNLKFSNKPFPAAESFSSMFLVKDTLKQLRGQKANNKAWPSSLILCSGLCCRLDTVTRTSSSVLRLQE